MSGGVEAESFMFAAPKDRISHRTSRPPLHLGAFVHQVPLFQEKNRFKGKQIPEKLCHKQKNVFPGAASPSGGKLKLYPSTDQRTQPPSSKLGRKTSKYRKPAPACNAYEQAKISPLFHVHFA